VCVCVCVRVCVCVCVCVCVQAYKPPHNVKLCSPQTQRKQLAARKSVRTAACLCATTLFVLLAQTVGYPSPVCNGRNRRLSSCARIVSREPTCTNVANYIRSWNCLLCVGFISLLGSARRPRLGPTSPERNANGGGHFFALRQDQGSQRRIGLGRGTGRNRCHRDAACAAPKGGRSSLVARLRWYQGENWRRRTLLVSRIGYSGKIRVEKACTHNVMMVANLEQ
jgi:hypothetical protein